MALWICKLLPSVFVYISPNIPPFSELDLYCIPKVGNRKWIDPRCDAPCRSALRGVWIVLSRFRKLLWSVHKGEEKQSHIIGAPVGCVWGHSWPIAALHQALPQLKVDASLQFHWNTEDTTLGSVSVTSRFSTRVVLNTYRTCQHVMCVFVFIYRSNKIPINDLVCNL